MFIIVGLSDTNAQVLDTVDGVVESLSKKEVFELSKKVTIQGVPKTSSGEWVSTGIKRVISILVSNNRIKEAIVSLPEGYKIELTLQSRPSSRSSTSFVRNYVYTYGKSDVNSWYKMEHHRSKSYRSGYSDEEVMKEIRFELDNYRLNNVIVTE